MQFWGDNFGIVIKISEQKLDKIIGLELVVSPFGSTGNRGEGAVVILLNRCTMKICIDQEWYDLTKWAPYHPGGECPYFELLTWS